MKGERCFSPKCSMIRNPYPPGQKKKRRRRGGLSEYGKELREKQKLKEWYGLRETQFRKYVKNVLNRKSGTEDAAQLLIKALESRLDNVVFRLGLAPSRAGARQLVSHGYFSVNGRKTDIPSFRVKKGDVILLSPRKAKKTIFQNIQSSLKKQKHPQWLEVNSEKLESKVVGEPSFEEVSPPVEISSIFEYYSR